MAMLEVDAEALTDVIWDVGSTTRPCMHGCKLHYEERERA
jgi:hypothetical protein